MKTIRLSGLLLALSVLLAAPQSSAASLKPPEIKAQYRQVLAVLATGNLDQAVADLIEFETRVVGEEQPWLRMESFWRIKLRTLRDLLNADTLDLLKPVVVVHEEAYFAYGKQGRKFMAGHSRAMATELAEIYGLRANNSEARAFGGSVLTNFGVILWSPTNIVQSSDLFLRATAVDPGNTIALLGLGTAYEHAGNYERAIQYLEATLRLENDDLANLRLALCKLRASEDYRDDAVGGLSSMASSGAEDWIRSIAFQELTLLRLTEGNLDEAEALARTGLQDLPGDQQLSVLLGSVLDLKRRPKETIEVLDGIPSNGWDNQSARQTYSTWHPGGMDEIRVGLREQMKSGLPALKTALGASFVQEVSE